MVLLLAPQSAHNFSNDLWSPGFANKVFATRVARESAGCGNCNGMLSTALNWSTMISTIRLSDASSLRNFANVQA